MKAVETGKDWLPLDNAAKIYPSTVSLESPAEFRLAFTLDEPVRLLWLQRALKKLMPRFPYYQVYLRRGFFWYYLQRSEIVPGVELLRNVPLGILPEKGSTSPLLRVSTRESVVAVDFSHILTDGNGGMRFLLALAAEYLRQAGVVEGILPGIMSRYENPSQEEFEDAHRKNFKKASVSPKKLSRAWHLQGNTLRTGRFRVLMGEAPVSEVLSVAKAKGVTLTEYLTALYIHSLARIYTAEKDNGKCSGRSIIRLEVPVDMRRFFPSATMRNFSLYLSPEIDMNLGDWSFQETVEEIHHSIQLLKNVKQLGRQIYRNVGSELNPLVRFMPLFAKDILLSSVYSRLGEGLHSGVLSNMGKIEVPGELQDHIRSLQIYINPNHVMKKSCGVLSFGGKLNITFTSVMEDTGLERIFFSSLARQGVDVCVQEM